MRIQILTEIPSDPSSFKIIDSVVEDWPQRVFEASLESKNMMLTELFWKQAEDLSTEPCLKNYTITAVPVVSQAQACVGGGGNGGIVRLYLKREQCLH